MSIVLYQSLIICSLRMSSEAGRTRWEETHVDADIWCSGQCFTRLSCTVTKTFAIDHNSGQSCSKSIQCTDKRSSMCVSSETKSGDNPKILSVSRMHMFPFAMWYGVVFPF